MSDGHPPDDHRNFVVFLAGVLLVIWGSAVLVQACGDVLLAS